MLFIYVCKSKNIISRAIASHSECIAWIEAIMTGPVWPVVVEFYNWPHWTGHNPHTPIKQNTAWVAYRALTTPEDGNHTPKQVGVEFGTY
jgi:hypothetical protein